MGYEINVALNGEHLFATHERSLQSERALKHCLKVFMKKFPESEGYKIRVYRWKSIEEHIDSILSESCISLANLKERKLIL